MGHPLDRQLPLHRRDPVRLLLYVDQLHRAMHPRILGPSPAIVHLHTPLGIGGPTGIERAVSALDDVAEESHRGRLAFTLVAGGAP